MNYNRTFIIVIIFLILLAVISGLPVPMIANAAKYAQVSREIVWTHEWINLHIGGDAYDQKPPLLFWLGALSFSLFGIKVIYYKLAVIFVSLVGIFSTFKLGQLLFDRKTGFLSAIFWATSLGYLHFHNDIHTDTLLATTVVFSVWQLAAFFRNRKWHQFLLGTAGIGLAMLTKGPVGLAIPAFAIGIDLLWKGKFNDIFHWRWLIAVVVVGVIIVPALLGLINQFGAEGIKFFFWTNNMGRITGTYYGGNSDPSFYIHTSVYVLAPWSIFSLTGIVLEIRELILSKGKSGKEGSLIALGAILPYLLILSTAKTKNPHYLLEVAPFMLILGARWAILIYETDAFTRLKKLLPAIHRGVAVLVWLLIMVAPFYIFPEKRLFFWIIMVGLFSGTIYFMLRKGLLINQVYMLAFAIAALLFVVNVNLMSNMMKFHSSIDVAALFNKEASSDATINMYGKPARLWDLFLYSKKPGKYLITNDDLKKFLPNPGAWIYTDDKGYEEIKKMGIGMEVLQTYKHKTLTRQSLKFLNPKTREAHFDKMYVVKLN